MNKMPFSLNSFINTNKNIDDFKKNGEFLGKLGATKNNNSNKLKGLYLNYIEKINYKPILNAEHLDEIVKIQKKISGDISQNQKRGTFKKNVWNANITFISRYSKKII